MDSNIHTTSQSSLEYNAEDDEDSSGEVLKDSLSIPSQNANNHSINEWQTAGLNQSVDQLPSRMGSARSNSKQQSHRNSFDSSNIRFRIRPGKDSQSKIVEQISENAGEPSEIQSVVTREKDLLVKLQEIKAKQFQNQYDLHQSPKLGGFGANKVNSFKNPPWFSESEGSYYSSPLKAKIVRGDQRLGKNQRVANDGEFPSDNHLDKGKRVRR